jgi:hypothetical protein
VDDHFYHNQEVIMSQEPLPEPIKPTYETYTWSQVWTKATLQPSVETYESLIRDPNAGVNRGILWVFLVTLVGFLLATLVQYFFLSLDISIFGLGESTAGIFGSLWLQLICGAPIAAIIAVVGLIIWAGITHLIAAVLGGQGEFGDLVYGFAAFSAPISLVTMLLGSIPYIGCLITLLGLYTVILTVIAIKAVYGFDWVRAIISALLIPILVFCFASVCVLSTIALLGDTISEVFNQISSALSTP